MPNQIQNQSEDNHSGLSLQVFLGIFKKAYQQGNLEKTAGKAI